MNHLDRSKMIFVTKTSFGKNYTILEVCAAFFDHSIFPNLRLFFIFLIKSKCFPTRFSVMLLIDLLKHTKLSVGKPAQRFHKLCFFFFNFRMYL